MESESAGDRSLRTGPVLSHQQRVHAAAIRRPTSTTAASTSGSREGTASASPDAAGSVATASTGAATSPSTAPLTCDPATRERTTAGRAGSGGDDNSGYPEPPAYRPPYGRGGGGSYPPTGRVFYSGGIFSRASGKALDVQGASTANQANVYTWDFVNQPNQLWDVIDQGGGRFAIVSQGSNKALDVANRESADGANVQQYRFTNGDNQLWRLERAGGGFYRIVSVSSRKCLDVDANRVRENGANVQLWTCNGQPQQQWRLGR